MEWQIGWWQWILVFAKRTRLADCGLSKLLNKLSTQPESPLLTFAIHEGSNEAAPLDYKNQLTARGIYYPVSISVCDDLQLHQMRVNNELYICRACRASWKLHLENRRLHLDIC